MNASFARECLYYPIEPMLWGNVKEAIRFHQALMQQPEEVLRRHQELALRALLEHAFENIPFYQRLISDMGDLRGESPFAILLRLPLVSKIDMRRDFSLFTDARWRKWRRSTSGTSGTPFLFYKDRIALLHMDAAMHAAYSWHGVQVGDRQARIWGRAIDFRKRAVQRFKDFLLNRRRISAFELTREKTLHGFRRLKRFKPSFFYCYPNAAFLFAQRFLNQGAADFPGLKAVICSGEVLLDRHRLALKTLFGCPVINEYGTTENGVLAFECQQGGMHILADNMFVEFLQDGRPVADGEVGEIVATEFHSRSLPFIRYRTGDLGRPLFSKTCACGRALPLMAIVEGRRDNFILCPDGARVYDAILAYVLKEGVLQFRAIQEDVNTLIIEVVTDTHYTKRLEEAYRKALGKHLGERMNVVLKPVPSIPLERVGKLRYFISQMPKDVEEL